MEILAQPEGPEQPAQQEMLGPSELRVLPVMLEQRAQPALRVPQDLQVMLGLRGRLVPPELRALRVMLELPAFYRREQQ